MPGIFPSPDNDLLRCDSTQGHNGAGKGCMLETFFGRRRKSIEANHPISPESWFVPRRLLQNYTGIFIEPQSW